MEKVVGAVLGFIAFTAIVAISLLKQLELVETLLRAALAMIIGWLLGHLLFGKFGFGLVQEAARELGDAPPKEESKSPPTITGS